MSMFKKHMITPRNLGVKERTIKPPKSGWEERTYYLVDVAFSPTNIIHRAIYYTGFLNGRDGAPGGYNMFAFYSNQYTIKDVYYLKAIEKINMRLEDETVL